jgi:hypothetical protein
MIRSFPFTGETYFSLFEAYNDTIWPAQIVAYLLGIAVLVLALRPILASGRIALAVLALFWLWNGLVYHLVFFLQINFAALPFSALFALQGLLLAGAAIRGGRQLRFVPDATDWVGLVYVLLRCSPIRYWAGPPVTAGRARRCSAWRRPRW